MSKRNHLKERLNEKLQAITFSTLVVGIDIAKKNQWARFVDCRGIEHGKALKFGNNKNGFEKILTTIFELCKKDDFTNVVIGMEPTGHYWKPLANYLLKQGLIVVLVNPYHTKKSKELDDNSQTKSDIKDALTIAKLVKDGRYFETYLPHDIYAELRGLTATRTSMLKRLKSIKNTIIAVLDEYFPEYESVFKCIFTGKASRQILKSCPIPSLILELGEDGVLTEIKSAVKKTVGRKKAKQLLEAAQNSIGVDYGESSAVFRIKQYMTELEMIENQLVEVEEEMNVALEKTGLSEYLLSIPGAGVVSMASVLGEMGDPLRFENPRQMSRMAGYNLIEDSSGKNKSGTCISKRGRKNLRCVLYKMALTMVAVNPEMKQLYSYLKTRENNPLKKMPALVVVSKKILTMIFTLSKKKEYYNPEKVFGNVRKEQLRVA
jgi:transposase